MIVRAECMHADAVFGFWVGTLEELRRGPEASGGANASVEPEAEN